MFKQLTEARKRPGIGKDTLNALVREGRFTVYTNPRDRRSKLLDTDELDAYLEPQVLHERKGNERC